MSDSLTAALIARVQELERRLSSLESSEYTGQASSLKPWFDVKRYGATGDGVTEDTTAVQAALTAAKGAAGGRVYLPAGAYLVGALALEDADNITICGDGPGRTILQLKAAGNGHIFQFTRCDDLTVCDLEIDGNKANQTSSVYRGIYWLADDAASGGTQCARGRFENLFIHDTCDQGLCVAGGQGVKIDKVDTAGCGSASGNIGAGIHITDAIPDTTIHSYDVQIANCSDNGSGLDGGTEGAGLQMQVNTSRITVTNYISRNAKKYGVKCQAHKVELNNIQVFEPGTYGIALQYNDVRLSNARIEKTTAGVATGIGIGAPQQAADPRDISMDLSNIHIVGQGFYTGIDITGTESATDPVRHVHIGNVNIQSVGADPITHGLRVMGNVQSCSIAHAHVRDCTTNIAMVNALIDSVNYSPTKMVLTDVHSEEVLAAGGASTYGWNLGYGSGLLIGCTSERMEGSSRILWQNLARTWGFVSAQRKAWCGTTEEGQPISKINAGAITVSNSAYVEVNAESGTADDLTDITDGVAGQIVLFKAYTTRTITIVHNASKIILPGGSNYTLAGDKRLLLCCIAPGKWTVLNA
jgi:hypothetical protein